MILLICLPFMSIVITFHYCVRLHHRKRLMCNILMGNLSCAIYLSAALRADFGCLMMQSTYIITLIRLVAFSEHFSEAMNNVPLDVPFIFRKRMFLFRTFSRKMSLKKEILQSSAFLIPVEIILSFRGQPSRTTGGPKIRISPPLLFSRLPEIVLLQSVSPIDVK